MRKNILSLSIAAMVGGLGLAGAASAGVISTGSNADALKVTTEGIGHILLVPYYSAQEGNATLLNIVNTDETNGKAVKVRFRGASNSDDVFDFTLFLSPGDVWAGQVSRNAATDLATLSFGDNSCTLPEGSNVKRDFVTDRLNPAADLANETREGYVEILNMANVPPKIGGADNALYTAIKHVNNVAPCRTTTAGKTALNKLATEVTTETEAFAAGLSYPTTGLFANWTIINVSDATSWTGEAAAIVATTEAGAPAAANIVLFPQKDSAPTIPAGGISALTADPLLVQEKVEIRNYDLPDLSTPYTVSTNANAALIQAHQLTSAIAKTTIKNEYITTDAIQASTDWVFSFPTRRYHMALDYAGTKTNGKLTNANIIYNPSVYFLGGVVGTPAVAVQNANTSVMGASGKEQICLTKVTSYAYNREENKGEQEDFVISPSTPAQTPALCGEVAVWSFNAGGTTDPSALSAAVARGNIEVGFADGWAAFNTPSAVSGGYGLPILGAAFTKAVNPYVAAGVSGTYGAAWNHRYSSGTPLSFNAQ